MHKAQSHKQQETHARALAKRRSLEAQSKHQAQGMAVAVLPGAQQLHGPGRMEVQIHLLKHEADPNGAGAFLAVVGEAGDARKELEELRLSLTRYLIRESKYIARKNIPKL